MLLCLLVVALGLTTRPAVRPSSVRLTIAAVVLFWFVMCCQLQFVVMHCFAKSWHFLRVEYDW